MRAHHAAVLPRTTQIRSLWDAAGSDRIWVTEMRRVEVISAGDVGMVAISTNTVQFKV